MYASSSVSFFDAVVDDVVVVVAEDVDLLLFPLDAAVDEEANDDCCCVGGGGEDRTNFQSTYDMIAKPKTLKQSSMLLPGLLSLSIMDMAAWGGSLTR